MSQCKYSLGLGLAILTLAVILLSGCTESPNPKYSPGDIVSNSIQFDYGDELILILKDDQKGNYEILNVKDEIFSRSDKRTASYKDTEGQYPYLIKKLSDIELQMVLNETNRWE